MMLARRGSTRADAVIGTLLGLSSLGLYVKTLAPTLLMADAAEFQLACYTLGIAHPTGYPLYAMVGWLWSHLVPLGDAAYRVNLLSAVFAAWSVGLLYPLLLSVVRSALPTSHGATLRAVAFLATVTLAVSRTFWSQAVRAEVYALNSLFVVAMLYLLLHWAESRSPRTLQAAALVYGLSLTHHVTMILLLPACLVFVWLTDRSVFRSPKFFGTLLVLTGLPLALYLYIPWRAPDTPYLHLDLAPGRTLELYDNSLRGFVSFLTAEMFQGQLGYQAPIVDRLAMAATQLLRQFGIVGTGLGLLGVVRLALPSSGHRSRRILVLLGLCYCAVVAFTLFYHIGDIQVLYTPSYILFALWMGVGMAWLPDAVGARIGVSSSVARAVSWGLIALFALLPLGSLWNNYSSVDKSGDHVARQWAEEILSQPVPEGAILVSNDRNEITPLLYLQYVEGQRPDLLTMFPLVLPGDEYSNVVRVIDGVLDVDRPLLLVKPMPGLEIKYQMEPLGELAQITGPAITGAPEYPVDLALDDSLTLLGYDLDPDEPLQGRELRISLHWRVGQDLSQDYHTYVHLLDEHGEVIAQSDHRPGQEYYPSSLWQTGETVLDRNVLFIPADAALDEVTVTAGAYEYPSLVPLGNALNLGEVRISR
jgi:hypothetical protein